MALSAIACLQRFKRETSFVAIVAKAPLRRPRNFEATLLWTIQWSNFVEDLEVIMQVSVTEAKGQLTDLVRRAAAGDEVVITRHGHPAVRLVPIKPIKDEQARRDLILAVRRSASARRRLGEEAARSQDFLYDDDGLPK